MKEQLIHLLDKQVAGTLTPHERWELMGLILEPSLQSDLQAYLETSWDKTGEDHGMPGDKIIALFTQVSTEEDGAKVITMEPAKYKKKIWKWFAAASILLIAGLGIYFLFFNNGSGKTDPPVAVVKEIKAPGTSKAMITLGNGRKIPVDSLTAINDGSIQLSKNDKGEIIYNGQSPEAIYNTLDNPRGSTVANITLIDGTKVWLNAASSLKYFASNTGQERIVEITGEAYFEVAKDEQRPFIVKKGETSVTVLGTHFNVNAYDDEENLKVTLLEGSVQVQSQNSKLKIQPGEQALVNSSVIQLVNPDLEEVMAWKSGYFNFNNASVQVVMRQISRWYDVEVQYEGTPPTDRLIGEVPRDASIDEVLKALQRIQVKLRIEGRKIIVMQ